VHNQRNENAFAELLMSSERKKWQDPEKILDQIGIDENTNCADLGCGPGFLTIPLALRVGKTATIYAVDQSSVMLAHLEKNLKGSVPEEISRKVKVIQADVTRTTIPNGSVNLVIFAQLLHDLEDHAAFFDEIKRSSTERCRIVDIDWQKRETDDMGPPLEIRLSEDESRKIIERNGFRVVHALNAGPYHYGLVCQRTN
jgi:ubiquinone/menaquinone biosynthesis C-methylase UbiE